MLFGTFGFRIFMDIPMLSRKDGVCLILQEQEDTFFIMGNACMITFFSQDPKRPNAEIFFCEEGHFEKDRWKKGRRLNGDEVAVLMMERPGLLKLKLHAFS